MAEKTVFNMNKTNKTRTEFNLFESQETRPHLCSQRIKVLSGSTEERISVEENSFKTTSKKKPIELFNVLNLNGPNERMFIIRK